VGVSVNGMSALYAACNRGKRCIAVDIHTDDGQAIVRRLAADTDVVVQNFRPGTLERHGLGYDDLREGHDDLVYVSLSGFGSVGPYSGKSAYDTVIQAYGGFGANQADPANGIPVFLRQTAADKVTALTAAQAVTAALFARERGHGGQHVELSMLDAVVSFLWADAAGNEVLMDSDGSRPSSFVATFRPFRFVDGWGIATPTSDHDFVGIMRGFGIEGAEDPRVATIAERAKHADMTASMMSQCYDVAATLTTDEVMERLNAQRVPCGVVLSPAELVDDEHARAIGLFVERDHPVVGHLRLPRHPILFGETPAELGGSAPALGEHTDEILGEIGWRDRADDLRAAGVIA
jgi:crotonobetainyl-CoA:carnitine CoA-transferase CaiB-like acyl-CoA transferase